MHPFSRKRELHLNLIVRLPPQTDAARVQLDKQEKWLPSETRSCSKFAVKVDISNTFWIWNIAKQTSFHALLSYSDLRSQKCCIVETKNWWSGICRFVRKSRDKRIFKAFYSDCSHRFHSRHVCVKAWRSTSERLGESGEVHGAKMHPGDSSVQTWWQSEDFVKSHCIFKWMGECESIGFQHTKFLFCFRSRLLSFSCTIWHDVSHEPARLWQNRLIRASISIYSSTCRWRVSQTFSARRKKSSLDRYQLGIVYALNCLCGPQRVKAWFSKRGACQCQSHATKVGKVTTQPTTRCVSSSNPWSALAEDIRVSNFPESKAQKRTSFATEYTPEVLRHSTSEWDTKPQM